MPWEIRENEIKSHFLTGHILTFPQQWKSFSSSILKCKRHFDLNEGWRFSSSGKWKFPFIDVLVDVTCEGGDRCYQQRRCYKRVKPCSLIKQKPLSKLIDIKPALCVQQTNWGGEQQRTFMSSKTWIKNVFGRSKLLKPFPRKIENAIKTKS